MSNTNTITVTGNMTAPATLKYTEGKGQPYAKGRVAVESRYNAGGEWRSNTSFINFVVFGDQAEHLVASTDKGSRVTLTGRLDIREYEPTPGVKAWFTEINVAQASLALRFDMYAPVEKVELPA